jgi:hypothetical protein
MVLPAAVDGKFERIAQEFANRYRLAAAGLQAKRKILLYGNSGCGKSLGAERLAWDAGLPLLATDLGQLLALSYQETHANIRAVLAEASKQPCVLLFDHSYVRADAVGLLPVLKLPAVSVIGIAHEAAKLAALADEPTVTRDGLMAVITAYRKFT